MTGRCQSYEGLSPCTGRDLQSRSGVVLPTRQRAWPAFGLHGAVCVLLESGQDGVRGVVHCRCGSALS